MSYRPRVKTDTSGNKIDFPLDAETVKGEDVVNTKQDKLVSGTNIKTLNGLSLLGSGDISTSGITEISTQYIRITDLQTGIYKLTYAGTKYIYYSGTTGTSLHTITGGAGAVILTVNKYSTTYWHWYYINGTTGYETVYYGYTSTSSGATSSKALNSLLTSHLYRPIQVNGTQILANSSSTALNLSNDGNVKFAQVSGGKVKASITGLEVAKLYDFTVYNDSYSWGHLTSGNGYTQLFSLDTANGASIGLAEKDGKLSMQIDGDYYFNEGQEKVIGTNTVYNPGQVICNFNGITGGNGDRYVKIYESSDIDASNFGDFHIKGVFGGWSMNEKVMIDAFVSTRGDGRQLFCTKLYNSFNSEQRSIADTRAYLAVGTENNHVAVWLCCGDWGSYHIVEMSCNQGTIFVPNSDDFIAGRPSYSMSSQGTNAYNKVLN